MNTKTDPSPKWQLGALPNHNKPWSSFPKSVPHLAARANPSAHSWFPSPNRSSQDTPQIQVPRPNCALRAPVAPKPLNSIDLAQKSPAAFPTRASAQDACDSGFVITARKFHREKSKNLCFSFMSFIKLTILQVIVTTTFIPCPHHLLLSFL